MTFLVDFVKVSTSPMLMIQYFFFSCFTKVFSLSVDFNFGKLLNRKVWELFYVLCLSDCENNHQLQPYFEHKPLDIWLLITFLRGRHSSFYFHVLTPEFFGCTSSWPLHQCAALAVLFAMDRKHSFAHRGLSVAESIDGGVGQASNSNHFSPCTVIWQKQLAVWVGTICKWREREV